MLFNSYIFILLFLPVSVLGYFLLNRMKYYKWADVFLIGMSLWFYGYYNPKYLLIIGISVLGNYLCSQAIIKTQAKKCILIVGILANAGSIFYYKYFDFFIENINNFFGQSFELRHIILPLGISFFTFQQMSYLVDTYRGQTNDYGFIEYALFVVFFPQLIAGPIVLHKETVPQFRDEKNRIFSAENTARGLFVFSIGLFKKVLIADTFSKAVGWGFSSIDTITAMEAIIVSFCYTFQLYFDFSGYCDMAVGIGCMFNILLPQNFNSPYKALSIIEFWDRWHMSLTRFLREYVYFPLGGGKKGRIRTYLNVMIVFLVSGIWHGANWTFILWGMMHGVFNCLSRAFKNIWCKVNTITRWTVTFGIVNALWVIFRADSISQAIKFLFRMIRMENLSVSDELGKCFWLPELRMLAKWKPFDYLFSKIENVWLWIFLFGGFVIVLNVKNIFEIQFKKSLFQGILTVVFLVWSIMSLAGVSEFLYFGF